MPEISSVTLGHRPSHASIRQNQGGGHLTASALDLQKPDSVFGNDQIKSPLYTETDIRSLIFDNFHDDPSVLKPLGLACRKFRQETKGYLTYFKPLTDEALDALLDQKFGMRIEHLDLSLIKTINRDAINRISRLENLKNITFGHNATPNSQAFQMFIKNVSLSHNGIIESALIEYLPSFLHFADFDSIKEFLAKALSKASKENLDNDLLVNKKMYDSNGSLEALKSLAADPSITAEEFQRIAHHPFFSRKHPLQPGTSERNVLIQEAFLRPSDAIQIKAFELITPKLFPNKEERIELRGPAFNFASLEIQKKILTKESLRKISTEEERGALIRWALCSDSLELQEKAVTFITPEFISSAEKRIEFRDMALILTDHKVQRSLLTKESLKQIPTENECMALLSTALFHEPGESQEKQQALKENQKRAIALITSEFVSIANKRIELRERALNHSSPEVVQNFLLTKEALEQITGESAEEERVSLIEKGLIHPLLELRLKTATLITSELLPNEYMRMRLSKIQIGSALRP